MPIDENGRFHPGFMAKVTGFLVTYADWAAAGFPRRDPEETRELFHTHCNPPGARCVNYDPDSRAIPIVGVVGVCTACGCHVSDNPDELLNKITLPTAGCPIGRWAPCVEKVNE